MEPYLGQIQIFAFSFAPAGWARCEGQLLPISQNQALFALLGTMYGGNGQTTFALPDMRNMEAGTGEGNKQYYHRGLEGTALAYCIALQGIFPSRN
jgi:microcystin-dependent protein